MNKQNEITKPTELLDDNGNLTNPGYCKRNLFVYNREKISASKLRLKEWDFYQMANKDYMVQVCFANIGLGTAATASLLEFKTGRVISSMKIVPFTTNRFIPPRVSDQPNKFEFKRGNVSLLLDTTETTRQVKFTGRAKGKPFTVDFTMDMLPNHESITIATPWQKQGRFFLTDKVDCMPTDGVVTFGDEKWSFSKKDTFGILDWGRGVWPHSNKWYWANGSTWLNGKLFGFELTWGFGDESNATETAIFYDGKCHKIGHVDVNPKPQGKWLEDWHFVSEDGRFDFTMKPFYDNETGIKVLGLVGAKCHQVHGLWTGRAVLDNGEVLEVKDMYAFCEYMENLW